MISIAWDHRWWPPRQVDPGIWSEYLETGFVTTKGVRLRRVSHGAGRGTPGYIEWAFFSDPNPEICSACGRFWTWPEMLQPRSKGDVDIGKREMGPWFSEAAMRGPLLHLQKHFCSQFSMYIYAWILIFSQFWLDISHYITICWLKKKWHWRRVHFFLVEFRILASLLKNIHITGFPHSTV